MNDAAPLPRLATGIPDFDALTGGGIPAGSLVVVAGPPGAGKTIFTQQACFHNAGPDRPVLFFNTLSEPTAKTLRNLSQFRFFDAAKFNAGSVQYVDIGGVLRAEGLAKASEAIMVRVREVKPAIVVIDSFKAFDDLASSRSELRRFGYELAVNLMAWQATTFLLGEFSPEDIATKPVFSITDGLVVLSQRRQAGEQQRFVQIVKLRGTAHARDEHPFEISTDGVVVYGPRRAAPAGAAPAGRLRANVSRFDELAGDGIPHGSSLLVSGVAGTGKTVFLLESLYRGAQAGEKGVFFSFEETEARLRATAAGFGWDLEREVRRGMLELVFVPQSSISIERNLAAMQARIGSGGVRRVAVDSVSIFLHNLADPEASREKLYRLTSAIQAAGAVGFLAVDIPYGSGRLSRFGVEETVVDGVVLLSATEEGFERQRYIEIYKLRNTAHLKGRHSMLVGREGLQIFPRYFATEMLNEPPPAVNTEVRLKTGVAGLDPLVGGGVFERSVTLVSGSAGIGKTTLAMQFILEGTRSGDRGLFVALEESPGQIVNAGESLGLPVKAAVDQGRLDIMYLTRLNVRTNQFLTVLSERIAATGAKRLAIDGVGQLLTAGAHGEDVRQMLYGLSARFKRLGVTTLFTLEARSLHVAELIEEQGFSPAADNLVLLRYESEPGAFTPYLAVVKTRGSLNERGKHAFAVGHGGASVGARLTEAAQD